MDQEKLHMKQQLSNEIYSIRYQLGTMISTSDKYKQLENELEQKSKQFRELS